MNNKRKIILTGVFVFSLLPMFLSWFGIARGVQEIKGLIVLGNPVTLWCSIAFLICTWVNVEREKIRTVISTVSLSGIICVEIFEFFAWHYNEITPQYSWSVSFQIAYPEFYFGFSVSVAMLIFYLIYGRNKSAN